jgi:hypothetical protein
VVNNPPVRRAQEQRATRHADHPDPPVASTSTLAALFDDEEIGGPSKARDRVHSTSSKKKRRRIGDESTPEDRPYKPARPVVSGPSRHLYCKTDMQTPVDQSKTRPPSAREKKKPTIQLGVVKLETPTPESEPELPVAPSKSAQRRRRYIERDDGDESDDGESPGGSEYCKLIMTALGQW